MNPVSDNPATQVRLVRATQFVMAGALPLIWVTALLWRGAGDFAGAATFVLPALVLSQELTVLVVKGRISRTRAALVRLSVSGLLIITVYLVNLAR